MAKSKCNTSAAASDTGGGLQTESGPSVVGGFVILILVCAIAAGWSWMIAEAVFNRRERLAQVAATEAVRDARQKSLTMFWSKDNVEVQRQGSQDYYVATFPDGTSLGGPGGFVASEVDRRIERQNEFVKYLHTLAVPLRKAELPEPSKEFSILDGEVWISEGNIIIR